MAGHSKFSNIKAKKEKNDSAKGKIFTRIGKEILIAVKEGGPDVNNNSKLRQIVAKAKANNMPNDNIERSIKKAASSSEAELESIVYEGYGPGGTAVMVECLTDNRKRTVSDVRHAFTKTGGNLGTDGSVAYLFTRKGIISYAPGLDEDAVMDAALEAGAEDVETFDDGAIDVYTAWEILGDVKDAMDAAGFKAESAEVSMIPSTKADLDAETAPKLMRLIDMLEDSDDVQEVYHNGDISDEVAALL